MTSNTHSIARILAGLGTSSSFATRFSVKADPLLNVEGVGDIQLPVTLKTAHRLCAAAQPAQYGYKDLTLLDPQVRDTWEIPAERLRFASDKWAAVLDSAVRRIGKELALRERADTATLADDVATQRWGWLLGQITTVPSYVGESARVSTLVAMSGACVGLLRADCPAVTEQIISTLCSDQLPLQASLQSLHLAESSGLRLPRLYTYCVQELEVKLASPERAATDWSIMLPAEGGRLDDVTRLLRNFLASPHQQRLEWPLAEAKRRLVHRFIDTLELPVTHETRRTGRPYVLVLEKTCALFEREAAVRRWWQQELAWLQGMEERLI